jgi:hypothetical protein
VDIERSQRAIAVLNEVAAKAGHRPRPDEALRRTCSGLRRGFQDHSWQHDLLAACTRVDPRTLPADDESFWLAFAVRVVDPPGGSAHDAADDEAYADWHALSAADWLGAGTEILRRGPGAPADAEALATYAAESTYARELRAHDVTSDALAARFRPADVLWRALGAIDSEAQLTELGAWGIPRALLCAWKAD